MNVEVAALGPDNALWMELADFAQNCSWEAGPHLAMLLREKRFKGWETPFAALPFLQT